jgi:hypothetical protein
MMQENKLIAEFMGYHYVAETKMTHDYFMVKGRYIRPDGIKFDTDWNWLMDVVDKIEGLNFSVEINRQEERDYQCLIVKKEIIVQTFSSNKMQSIYQAVIKFIKYYEQNSN